MFSPSDYNDAVPQFTNGNYANTPLNPLYVEEPDAVNYNRGAEPLQTLPAQWWNWLCNKITSKLNNLNIFVKNIFDELAGLLSVVGETPDATSEEITTEQLKGMFKTKYPQHLYDNFKFESVLQGRTRGVMLPPSDTWDAGTHTLSLSGGFGILNTYKKINFADSTLVLPNDNSIYYIVANSNGTISIENTLSDSVVLVGLCYDDEYLLCKDFVFSQGIRTIKLHKWYGEHKITNSLVSLLQTYYNVAVSAIETNISINTVNSNSIDGGSFDNCTISINTVGSGGAGINNGTFTNSIISITSVSGFTSRGILGGTFINSTISIDKIGSYSAGIGPSKFINSTISFGTVTGGSCINGGTFISSTISFGTLSGGSGITNANALNFYNSIISFDTITGGTGVYGGYFTNSTISIDTLTGGTGINNANTVDLYLTRIVCWDITNLSNTDGKLNILNDTVLHAS